MGVHPFSPVLRGHPDRLRRRRRRRQRHGRHGVRAVDPEPERRPRPRAVRWPDRRRAVGGRLQQVCEQDGAAAAVRRRQGQRVVPRERRRCGGGGLGWGLGRRSGGCDVAHVVVCSVSE